MCRSRQSSGSPTKTTYIIDQDNTHTILQVSEQAKSDHRKIQYASSKVPLELWREGRLRQSTICLQIYVWFEAKEQIIDNNNVDNLPREYTLDDTGFGTVKIRPQEDSIHLLKGCTRTMAGRSAQTVNNMFVDICIYRGKGAVHWQQKRKEYFKRVQHRWYRSWNGQNPTTGILYKPFRRSHSNHWSALGLEIWTICPRIWLYQEGMEIICFLLLSLPLLFILVERILWPYLFLSRFIWSYQRRLEVHSSSFF